MNNKPSIIKTERMELHSISVNDADNLIDILTDKEIALTYMVPQFKSKDEAYKLFERIMQLSLSEIFVYGIYLNNELIGLINEVDKDGSQIELGYVVSAKHQGNGYATEALKHSINALFDMGYTTVIAGAFEYNIASMRVMEKCGMKKCDYTEIVEYNGKSITCIIYDIKRNPND